MHELLCRGEEYHTTGGMANAVMGLSPLNPTYLSCSIFEPERRITGARTKGGGSISSWADRTVVISRGG